jgi:hypothetical protein
MDLMSDGSSKSKRRAIGLSREFNGRGSKM